MRSSVLGVVILIFLAIPAAAQTTTYTYTGDPYTAATAPYVVGGQVTGTFTTASPLPAFLPLTDIRPSLQSLSFSDGVATRTLANSFVCTFSVATDGAGNITQWQILLRESPYTPLNPQHSIDSSGAPGLIQGNDLAGTGPAGAGPCDPIALTTSGSSGSQGAWTDTFNQASQPTTYTYTGDPYTSANPPYVVGGNLDRHDHDREPAAAVPAAHRHHARDRVAVVQRRRPDAHARELGRLHLPGRDRRRRQHHRAGRSRCASSRSRPGNPQHTHRLDRTGGRHRRKRPRRHRQRGRGSVRSDRADHERDRRRRRAPGPTTIPSERSRRRTPTPAIPTPPRPRRTRSAGS